MFKVPLVVSTQRSKNSYPNLQKLRPHAVFSGPGVPGTLDLLADLITSVSSALPQLGHLPWNKFRLPPARKSLRLLLLPCPELTAVAENIKPRSCPLPRTLVGLLLLAAPQSAQEETAFLREDLQAPQRG